MLRNEYSLRGIPGAVIVSMASVITAYAEEAAGEAPDYSKSECRYQIPEITKDVDTFFCNNIEDNVAKRYAGSC